MQMLSGWHDFSSVTPSSGGFSTGVCLCETWLIVLNLLMSNTNAFHMEGSASWTQLRYFSPLYLPRICHGCPLANTMKRNSRSIVHWCTWLLKAARWFTHSCWHHFVIHSLNATGHLMRHINSNTFVLASLVKSLCFFVIPTNFIFLLKASQIGTEHSSGTCESWS